MLGKEPPLEMSPSRLQGGVAFPHRETDTHTNTQTCALPKNETYPFLAFPLQSDGRRDGVRQKIHFNCMRREYRQIHPLLNALACHSNAPLPPLSLARARGGDSLGKINCMVWWGDETQERSDDSRTATGAHQLLFAGKCWRPNRAPSAVQCVLGLRSRERREPYSPTTSSFLTPTVTSRP